jgi:hypothetical protein
MLCVVEGARARAHETLCKFHVRKSPTSKSRGIQRVYRRPDCANERKLELEVEEEARWGSRTKSRGVDEGQGKRVTERQRRPLFTSDSACVRGVNKAFKWWSSGLGVEEREQYLERRVNLLCCVGLMIKLRLPACHRKAEARLTISGTPPSSPKNLLVRG